MRILSLDAFTRAHLAFEQQLRRYAMTPHGKTTLTGSVLENLMRRSAVSLKATNARARLAVAKAAKAVLGREFGKQDQVFFLTFAPRQFAVPLSQAKTFDLQRLRDWVREQMQNHDYLGVIEGAYYSNYPRHPYKHSREPWVSFHVHCLCWNTDEAAMQRMVDRINDTSVAFLTGLDAAHVHRFRQDGAHARIFYMLKAPLDDYRVVNVTKVRQVPVQRKRPLRPGDAVRMCQAIGDRTMDDIIIGGGNGVDLADQILSRARRVIQREDRLMNRRLAALTRLPAYPARRGRHGRRTR